MTALQSREQHRVKRQIRALLQTYGAAHLDLACHAAFPFAVTSELLYCLRENFVPEAPWIAVADLLLSSLFDSVGEDLYELAPEVRAFLLEHLARDNRFGEARLAALADFSAAYVNAKLPENPRATREIGQEFDWLALACVRPGEAAQQMAARLQAAMAEERDEDRQRWVELIEGQEDMLTRLGLEPAWLWPENSEPASEPKIVTNADADWPPLRWLEFEVATLRQQDAWPPLQTQELTVATLTIEEFLEPFECEVVTLQRRSRRQFWQYRESLSQEVYLEMVSIPAGKFLMGASPNDTAGSRNERPQREVTVEPFFMAKYPVTQQQWRVVASLESIKQDLNPNPSHFKGDNRPVEGISWYDAMEFCARLSRITGQEYRLPSEAEWEYACRAGTVTPFFFGRSITAQLANYDARTTFGWGPKGEYREETTSVDRFFANAFGLWDMHGNVWEWCLDPWHENYQDAPSDSSAWVVYGNESRRILRGGSWGYDPKGCRSASRENDSPTRKDRDIGFRVVCVDL